MKACSSVKDNDAAVWIGCLGMPACHYKKLQRSLDETRASRLRRYRDGGRGRTVAAADRAGTAVVV
jgi:hypothetical protein